MKLVCTFSEIGVCTQQNVWGDGCFDGSGFNAPERGRRHGWLEGGGKKQPSPAQGNGRYAGDGVCVDVCVGDGSLT